MRKINAPTFEQEMLTSFMSTHYASTLKEHGVKGNILMSKIILTNEVNN